MVIRPSLRPVLLVVTLLLTAPPTEAQNWGDRWKIQVSAGFHSLAGNSTRTNTPAFLADHSTKGDATGLGLSLECRVTPSFSLEVGAQIAEIDNELAWIESGLRETQSMDTYSWLVGFDWHPLSHRDSRVDWTVGLFVAQANFSDVTFFAGTPRETTLRFDDDLGLGLKLGADVPLSERWFLNTELRASAILLESERAGEDLDLDPLTIAVGIGYRF